MTLQDLEKYNPITIQCHDNPDADAIASGYGLYCYYKDKGKDVRLVYSGRNQIQKSNLIMMVEHLKLPVEYIPPKESGPVHVDGLLITVDCQYGAGNVTGLTGDEIAIIDHHQVEITGVEQAVINPNLGSCSTLVWRMLEEAGCKVKDENLGTALYYGLYTDTNQFTEIFSPIDMDMREAVPVDRSKITLFRNSNLSLKELEIAGIAMIRYSYNDDYEFAVIHAQKCDPNILGLISDFLLQVDVIKTCVVFNETGDGYKFSVRSCIREVNASELAAYLAEGIGSGGGHYEKAGGFISLVKYEEKYPTLHADGYFNNRMTQYFDSFDLIYVDEYEVDISAMKSYVKKKIPLGYVELDQVLPVGTPVTIRTIEGDVELTVEEDIYAMIGIKGEVWPNRREKFEQAYVRLPQKYSLEECVLQSEYVPVIKNRSDGSNLILTDYAKTCISSGEVHIHARQLTRGVKVFNPWYPRNYMLGKPGDYLAVRCGDLHDIYVIEKDVFARSYDETVHV